MIKNKTIYILGTPYTIYFDSPEEKMPDGADGCMDQSLHVIRIAQFKADKNTIQDMESYKKKVLRHEIIHAFLYESGLRNNSGNVQAWAQSEEITDWIAIQSPKLFQAFKEANCL